MGRPRFHIQPLAALAVLLCGAIFAIVPASALAGPGSCTDSWLSAVSGSWTNPANWSEDAVPTASDDVCIQVAGTYTVTLPANATVSSLTIGNTSGAGTQTLTVGGPGDSPTLTLATNSTINETGELALDTSGGPVYLSAPTTATLSDSGQFLVMDDGTTSDYLRANLEIGASGDAEVAGALIQDVNTTTTNLGTFTVDGTGSIRLTSGEDVFTNDGSVVNSGALTLSGNASWTQNAGAAVQSGNPVEIFSGGLLDDESGAGRFYLIDSAQLEGTIPAQQTVTAEALPGHNANVSLVGTSVTNDGTLLLDEPSTG